MNFVGSANVAATIVVFELACSQEQEKKRRLISSASEALFGEIFGSKSFSLLQVWALLLCNVHLNTLIQMRVRAQYLQTKALREYFPYDADLISNSLCFCCKV